MADARLEPPHWPGRPFIGSAFFALPQQKDESAIRAVEPTTGKVRWEFKHFSGAWAGVLSTAGGLVFSGDGQGNFIALDAVTGRDVWHMLLGAPIKHGGHQLRHRCPPVHHDCGGPISVHFRAPASGGNRQGQPVGAGSKSLTSLSFSSH